MYKSTLRLSDISPKWHPVENNGIIFINLTDACRTWANPAEGGTSEGGHFEILYVIGGFQSW